MTDQPVVTVTTDVVDGAVVRWHPSVDDAALMRPTVSASQYGVSLHNHHLHQVPEPWLAAAQAAYEQLRLTPGADLTHLATHRNSVVSNGPLVPVDREQEGG